MNGKTKSWFGIPWFAWAAFFILAALFRYFPQIDLWVSGLACDSDPTRLFYFNHPLVVRLIYHSVEVAAVGVVLILSALLAAVRLYQRPVWGMTGKSLFYLLLVLALGPGLLVNAVSKNLSGRARPAHIEQFGGKLKFSPAFVLSDQCPGNCAFVSGHAALAFYFIAFAMVCPHHRKKIFIATLAYGTLVGAGRIYQGGHFLSDVVFAFFFVYFTARLVFHAMYARGRATSTG